MPMTEFTRRMYALCDEATQKVPKYHPNRFRQMLDRSDGDFAPKAKELLRGDINSGLVRLAAAGVSEISMEAIIGELCSEEFNSEDRELARWRIAEAERLAKAGEDAPSDW